MTHHTYYCNLLVLLLCIYNVLGFAGLPGNGGGISSPARLHSAKQPRISFKALRNNRKNQYLNVNMNVADDKEPHLSRVDTEDSSLIPTYYEFLCSQYDETAKKLSHVKEQLQARGISTLLSPTTTTTTPGGGGGLKNAASISQTSSRVQIEDSVNDSSSSSSGSSSIDSAHEPQVYLHPCSCMGMQGRFTVAELNTQRRAPLLLSSSSAATGGGNTETETGTDGNICSTCDETYDYSPLVEHSHSIAGTVVDALLSRPGVLLRPLLVVSVLALLKALSATLSAAVSTAVVGDLLSVVHLLGLELGQIYHQMAGVEPFSLAGAWTELLEGLPVLVRTLSSGWNIFVASLTKTLTGTAASVGGTSATGTAQIPRAFYITLSSALQSFLSFDLSNSWLLRVLTSRWFWQQYGLWSVVYSMPLVLDVFLIKTLGEALWGQYSRLEKGVIMWLIDVENQLIESSIIREQQQQQLQQ